MEALFPAVYKGHTNSLGVSYIFPLQFVPCSVQRTAGCTFVMRVMHTPFLRPYG